MKDKVQKIREEVERLKSNLIYGACSSQIAMETRCKEEAYNEVLSIIDSLQEEPVNKDFEMALAEMIDKAQKCVVEPLVIAEQWKDELIKLAKSEESVSEEQVKEYTETQHVDKTCKENGNSLTQKSESINFEQELYKAFGQIKDFTLGIAIAKRFYDMGRKHNEPVSEEFEEALAREWQGYNDRGAATVDALEDNTQELAFAKGFYRGAKWQKEQMMKDAVDACVTEIRTYYKEENEIDFTVMYEKGIIPYEMEQEVKVIVIKED